MAEGTVPTVVMPLLRLGAARSSDWLSTLGLLLRRVAIRQRLYHSCGINVSHGNDIGGCQEGNILHDGNISSADTKRFEYVWYQRTQGAIIDTSTKEGEAGNNQLENRSSGLSVDGIDGCLLCRCRSLNVCVLWPVVELGQGDLLRLSDNGLRSCHFRDQQDEYSTGTASRGPNSTETPGMSPSFMYMIQIMGVIVLR